MNQYICSDLNNYINNNQKNKYATIHLVDINPKDFTLLDLDQLYPGLIENVKHGDIIENARYSGFRSDGISMIYQENGVKKRICVGYDLSDCNPSPRFKIFKDFVPSHWDPEFMHINSYIDSNLAEFYWHDEYPIMMMDSDKFPDLKNPNNYQSTNLDLKGWSMNSTIYYTVFSHDRENYLFCTVDLDLIDNFSVVTNSIYPTKKMLNNIPFLKILEKTHISIENMIMIDPNF